MRLLFSDCNIFPPSSFVVFGGFVSLGGILVVPLFWGLVLTHLFFRAFRWVKVKLFTDRS
jgi:hypothetical protein